MPLKDLFIEELRDLYSAENQLVKALPKIAKGAESAQLKQLITAHLEETKGQVERLKEVFDKLGKKPTGKTCKGMQGLVEEGREALEQDEEGAAFDLGICGGALRVEHYEIAAYTVSIAMANALGMSDAADLLTESLHEEEAAAEKILAASKPMLQEASGEGEEGEEDTAPGSKSAAKSPSKKASGRKR
jgi:ferritin-like metal-binding protein YciE